MNKKDVAQIKLYCAGMAALICENGTSVTIFAVLTGVHFLELMYHSTKGD